MENTKEKYTQTTVDGSNIVSSKAKAKITIAEVGERAYLITVVDEDGTTFNHLGYLQDHVLIAQAQSSEGITSSYFEDDHLIHQLSNKSPKVWTVKNYKLHKCK